MSFQCNILFLFFVLYIASLVNVLNLHYKIDDNIKCCHRHIFSAQNVLKPWVAFNGPQSPSQLGSR